MCCKPVKLLGHQTSSARAVAMVFFFNRDVVVMDGGFFFFFFRIVRRPTFPIRSFEAARARSQTASEHEEPQDLSTCRTRIKT